MHRVFVSDLHLDDPASGAFRRFAELLEVESARADEIYVLGDLVEMWVGDDDDGPEAAALVATLAAASRACPVHVMHGNRDFLLGETFARASGVTLIDDPYVLDGRTVLTHGDALCTDDREYQAMRAMFRSPQWQADTLGKPLAERQAMGAALRAQSRQTNANKPANIMDVNAAAAAKLLDEHGANRLIHGHTHRPGHYPGRIVLGAWHHCGWLAREHADTARLECFTLARRYAGIPL